MATTPIATESKTYAEIILAGADIKSEHHDEQTSDIKKLALAIPALADSLGTMAPQNSSSVNITGGSIGGAAIPNPAVNPIWDIEISGPSGSSPWDALTDKPAVVAEGSSKALARAKIDALAVGEYGYGGLEITQIAVTDMNLIPARSMQCVVSGMLNAPLEDQGKFLVQQMVHTNSWITQIAYGITTQEGKIFLRQKQAGVWSSSWREISGNRQTGYVEDTTGDMYPLITGLKGGLNMVNVWTTNAKISKNAPSPQRDGDTFTIVLTNGLPDNELLARPGQSLMGFTTKIVLNANGPFTFKWFSLINDWRLV